MIQSCQSKFWQQQVEHKRSKRAEEVLKSQEYDPNMWGVEPHGRRSEFKLQQQKAKLEYTKDLV